MPSLHIAHNADEVRTTGDWYYNFEYDVERERGLDFREDLFNPLVAIFALNGRNSAAVIASTEQRNAEEAAALRESEVRRRAELLDRPPCDEPIVRTLMRAAGQFIVERGDLKTIIAGYHWFADWGRDTMIALPGLTLVTGWTGIARSILLAFARSASEGMLPNRFPDAGEPPEYNTVDATLWFFYAVDRYLKYTENLGFVETDLFEALKDILEWHLRGTRYGIRADSDGLLLSGAPGVQLTWMDAKVGDWVVTPRHGKAVEIQALWYNALRIMQSLAHAFDDAVTENRCSELASLARANFTRLFWNEAAGCLYDVVNGGQKDSAIRPNQVFAVSLPHTMLSPEKARRVVDVVQRELLTPYGLRSLARTDPQYRPRYEGNQWARDSAYHQGTIWPWLMGPFITAYLEVHGRTAEARRQASAWLAEFDRHFREAGLGQVSEIFDADPPHEPRGCIAQAWSVAELLRAAVEDVFEIHPRPRRISLANGRKTLAATG